MTAKKAAVKTSAVAKKEVPKKAVVKKTAVKATATQSHKNAKRVLVCANGEQCFWTNDGKVIANLVELENTFASMANDVFAHHVTGSKNDFADWIHYVLGDTELAAKIRTAKQPKSARTMVVSRLKVYDI